MVGETPAARVPFRAWLRASNLAPLVALVVLFVASALLSPYFLQVGNLLNILRQVSYFGIVALGMTFVLIGGGIDLSVGSMMAIVGALAISALNATGGDTGSIALTFAVALGLGASFGFANGFLVAKGQIPSFIVTLGTFAIFRSQALYFGDAGEFRSESEAYGNIGMSDILGLPMPIWVWLILAGSFHLLLHRTRYGRHVCAIGSNEKVAKYSAIAVDRVRLVTYVLSGLTVAVASVLQSSRTNSLNSTNFGAGVELDAIAAVIIGGTPMTGGRGSIWGTVIGAIILGIINNMLNMMSVSIYLQGTVKGVVIIAVAYIQRKL